MTAAASTHYRDDRVTLHHGDCLDVLASLPANSVDSIVTDPPYGLGFMGKAWDDLPPGEEWAAECLRVLKPGGHLLAFGGTRTWHRLAVAVEDAGFEIRDSIAWLYGSGFPKSLDVSKAIDKTRDDRPDVVAVTSRLAALAKLSGISRAAVDTHMGTHDMGGWWLSTLPHRSACPSVENWSRLRDFIPGAHELDAEVWRLNGRKGTPGEAFQSRTVVGSRVTGAAMGRAPSGVDKGTGGTDFGSGQNVVDITAPSTPEAERWQGWGTALKPAFEPVVVGRKPLIGTVAGNVLAYGTGGLNIDATRVGGGAGRWPANVVLDESQAETLDQQSGNVKGAVSNGNKAGNGYHGNFGPVQQKPGYNDSGGASRFFAVMLPDEHGARSPHFPRDFDPPFRYVAKAPKRERPIVDGVAHPTVKPLALMRWLVRLVTPPGGTVLEPFAGSGTTVEAALLEGFRCIAIERETDYLPLTMARIHRHADALDLDGDAA